MSKISSETNTFHYNYYGATLELVREALTTNDR